VTGPGTTRSWRRAPRAVAKLDIWSYKHHGADSCPLLQVGANHSVLLLVIDISQDGNNDIQGTAEKNQESQQGEPNSVESRPSIVDLSKCLQGLERLAREQE